LPHQARPSHPRGTCLPARNGKPAHCGIHGSRSLGLRQPAKNRRRQNAAGARPGRHVGGHAPARHEIQGPPQMSIVPLSNRGDAAFFNAPADAPIRQVQRVGSAPVAEGPHSSCFSQSIGARQFAFNLVPRSASRPSGRRGPLSGLPANWLGGSPATRRSTTARGSSQPRSILKSTSHQSQPSSGLPSPATDAWASSSPACSPATAIAQMPSPRPLPSLASAIGSRAQHAAGRRQRRTAHAEVRGNASLKGTPPVNILGLTAKNRISLRGQGPLSATPLS